MSATRPSIAPKAPIMIMVTPANRANPVTHPLTGVWLSAVIWSAMSYLLQVPPAFRPTYGRTSPATDETRGAAGAWSRSPSAGESCVESRARPWPGGLRQGDDHGSPAGSAHRARTPARPQGRLGHSAG